MADGAQHTFDEWLVQKGEDMNWDAVAAVGQVLGSIAVFITLGYLAVQVRHQRQENQRALSQGRGDTARQLVLLQQDEKTAGWMAQANAALGVPELPWRKMLMDRTGLSSEAVSRLVAIELLWWDFRMQTIPFADQLSPLDRSGFDRFIKIHYANPGFARLVYEHAIKPISHPTAVRYIDNLLAAA